MNASLTSLFRAFVERDWRLDTSYRAAFVLRMGSLLFACATVYFLSLVVDPGVQVWEATQGHGYFLYAVVGIGLHDAMMSILSAFSMRLRQEQLQGTLEAMFATRTSWGRLMLAGGGYPVLAALLRFSLYLTVAMLFGATWRLGALVNSLPFLGLGILAFLALGVASAAFTLLLKRGEPVALILSALSFLLGGTVFPVTVLPVELQMLSRVLPNTWVIRGVRETLLNGVSLGSVNDILLILMMQVVFFSTLAAGLFRVASARVWRDGSLSQY